jgi:hypothetical protein
LLESLVTSSSELRSALGRVYLQAGQLDKAEYHFEVVETAAVTAATADDDDDDEGKQDVVSETTRALNVAFMASARGDWDKAGTILRHLVDSSSPQDDEDEDDDVDNTHHHYAVSLPPPYLQKDIEKKKRLLIIWRWRFLVKVS